MQIVSCETSEKLLDEHIYVLDGQTLVNRKVNSVGDKLRRAPHKLINIPRRDKQALGFFGLGKGGGINHRWNTDGGNGDAEKIVVECGAIVADTRARGNAGVAYLHVLAKPVKLAGGKCINGDNAIGLYEIANCFKSVGTLDAGRA